LKDLDVKLAVKQQGAAAVNPHDIEASVFFPEITLPHGFPLQIKCSELPRPNQRPDEFAIGHWRRGSAIPPPLGKHATRDIPLPKHFTIPPVKAHEPLVVFGIRAHHKNSIPRNNRRRSGNPGQVNGPLHAIRRAKFLRKAFLGRSSIERGTSPLGPTFGMSGDSESTSKNQGGQFHD
jgi:hypothetical protein